MGTADHLHWADQERALPVLATCISYILVEFFWSDTVDPFETKDGAFQILEV